MNDPDAQQHQAMPIAARLDRRAASLAVAPSTPSSVHRRVRQRQRRRVGAVSAIAALATASAVAVRVVSHDHARSVAPADTGVGSTATDATPSTAPSPAGPTSTGPAPVPVLSAALQLGDHGDDVATLQRRLRALGFDPGPADGVFGEATQQAVWAFQGLALARTTSQQTDVVDRAAWNFLMTTTEPPPRRPVKGTHVEIYLDLQVLTVFTNDRPTLITHISSGSGAQWCETVTIDTDDKGRPIDPPIQKDVCGVAKTPGGVFQIYRRYPGNRLSPLGGMFNPVYFNYGIAVHGAHEVPKEPVSHGTVRISEPIAEYFPSLVHDGDRVYVFDGLKEPESYDASESLPVFVYPNPNSATSASTP